MTIKRRQFIKAAAATTAIATQAVVENSALAAPFVRTTSKNPKYRTALIGSGWWGMNILKEAMAAGNTNVVALCDVDRDKLEIAAEDVEEIKPSSVSAMPEGLLDDLSVSEINNLFAYLMQGKQETVNKANDAPLVSQKELAPIR